MIELKKITVLLLGVVAFGTGLPIACFSQTEPNKTEPEKVVQESSRSEEQTSEGSNSLYGKNSDLSNDFNYDSDTGLYSNLIRAIFFVIILGVVAFYVSKKLLPRITNLPGKEVRVVETVYLGPRKAVHVLEVGSRRYLIGSTNENISKLADITEITSTFSELSAQEVGYN
jgi:flagellar biosynthetic protein FliO